MNLENPRQQALYDEALKRSIEFYDLDQQLSSTQRKDLAEFYRKVFVSNIFFLYLGFLPGLLIPFLRKYRQTGSIKGVNFFWATFTGFTGMIIAPQILSPIYFSSKFEELKQEKGAHSNEVKIVESLPLFMAIKWADYYKISAEDETKKMADPRLLLKDGAAAANNNGGLLSSGDLFGIKQGTTYGGIPERKETSDGTVHSWDEIRKQGFQNSGKLPSNTQSNQDTDSDIFSVDLNEQPSDQESMQWQQQQPVSSWDRVRKGSISSNGNLISSARQSNSVSGQDDKKSEQEKFEELLERERNASD